MLSLSISLQTIFCPSLPLAAANLLKSSFKKLFAAKLKLMRLLEELKPPPFQLKDLEAPTTLWNWGFSIHVLPKEDLLRITALLTSSMPVQSATQMVGVHLRCFREGFIILTHIITETGLCRDVWSGRVGARITFCWLARAHLLVPLGPDKQSQLGTKLCWTMGVNAASVRTPAQTSLDFNAIYNLTW